MPPTEKQPSTSGVVPLSPIDQVTLSEQPQRQASAELESELDALHEALGVRRGHALEEAMKPKLEVLAVVEEEVEVEVEVDAVVSIVVVMVVVVTVDVFEMSIGDGNHYPYGIIE